MPTTFRSRGPWYSTEEAAEIMGRTPGHVSRQCKKGAFECKKVGNSYLLHEDVLKRLRGEQVVKQLPDNEFNIAALAKRFNAEQVQIVEDKNYKHKVRILGILAPGAGDAASMVYAHTLRKACDFVGFELGLVRNELDAIRNRIEQANEDPSIHGIFVFYPIFKNWKDKELKELINPVKDIEGLSSFWWKKLYRDERYLDKDKKKKAILPCTSLGILKTLIHVDHLKEEGGQPFAGKNITIFNRSDVVGHPLAYMLNNDGATVYSFDINGGVVMRKDEEDVPISREEALRKSDTIITGVPSKDFEKIRGEEMRENTTCLNFSFVQNFTESAKEKAGIYVPRMGPMTIAMCVRNAIRLYENNIETYERINNPSDWTTYGTVVERDAA